MGSENKEVVARLPFFVLKSIVIHSFFYICIGIEKKTAVMISNWVPMLTFVLVCIILNNYIRWILPEKSVRMKFKAENEFYLVLAYFVAPLLMLQGELIYLNYASVTYEELNIFTFLVVIKVALFVTAGKNLETFLHNLKAYKTLKNYIQSE